MFSIYKNSLIAMIAVFCILAASSIFSIILQIRNSSHDYKELRLRIRSWWWMAAILFTVFIIGIKASVIFFGFLSFLALKEFCSIVELRYADRRVLFWAYLLIPIQYYLAFIGWYGVFIIFIPVYAFLFLPVRMVLIGKTEGFIRSISIIQWAVMLTVFCISHIAYLLILPVKNMEAGPIGLVIFLLFVTQFNDVCQYVCGKIFGKNKIIPKVSPNKTWEGLIGGVIFTTICSGLIGPFLTPLSVKYGFVFGFFIAVAGFFGDIVISSVKRDLNIKDSGNFIPGHGGILDRIDSLIYTSPIFFHIIYFTSY